MDNFLRNMFYKQRQAFNESSLKRSELMKLPEDVSIIHDIPYGDGEKAHRIDVYRPANNENNTLPVIVNVHGGGMILGSKEFNSYYCANLCKCGFIVFGVEYRLVPDVDAFGQYDDLSRAMDYINDNLLDRYNCDKDKVYLVADSGGACISIYTVAMQNCDQLALAAKVRPSSLKIRALGLISGMFYTTRYDKIGMFLPSFLYGKHYKRSSFAPYTNPDIKDIAGSLPPCYLVTSHNDMLRNYTIRFEKALTKYNIIHKLTDYPKNKKLTHAFSVFEPYIPESICEVHNMTQYLKTF